MLICKALRDERSYQSVLNTQRKVIIPFRPLNHDHIQLLHDGSSHWFLSFCQSGQIQICDSLKSSLKNRVSMKCLYALDKNVVGEFGKVTPTFLPVHEQTDGCYCGPFSITYAAEILDGKSLTETVFDVNEM